MNTTNSRFNFTKVTKAPRGGNTWKYPAPRADSIRLTSKNLVIGKDLMKRFGATRKTVTSVSVSLDKDIDRRALRVLPAAKGSPECETFKPNTSVSRNDLHTTRPRALFDMPNGNYVEDLKEAGVFVLVEA